MKSLLLILLMSGLIGFILDLYTRIFSVKDYSLDKKTSLLLLLNMPIYAIGGGLIYLLYKIPVFQNTDYAILFYLIGGILCCIVELGFGYLLNIKLKLNIWNYTLSIKLFGRTIPLNLLGQTDLLHLVGFTLLTIPVINLTEFITWFTK